MHDCPCCGEITYISSNPWDLCDECYAEGCEETKDSVGDWGYWECQRPDADTLDDGEWFLWE